ncbi:MAG: hypothetical protein A2749_00235 [Parcubacteria group bacterium RIFCSPHIGHO2_01_FULL_45_26]|nr:MAG: hypothetical protein A2749_00235 [Parcubacteria group bacterium RIFCSPHIGHO2_01_FULL_45_26]
MALPLVALIVSNSMFFPYITGKNFAFRIIVEIIFAAFLVLSLYDSSYRPKHSWILFAFATFLLATILGTIFGINPYRSFWSNFERMDGLINYIHLFAYFLVAVSVLNTERLWRIFFQVSMGVATLVAAYGILQIFGLTKISQSATRLDATFGNATYLAVYMMFNLFISLKFLFDSIKTSWTKWLYGPLSLLSFIIIYKTATRGVILGTLGGLFLAMLIVAWKSGPSIRKFAISGILAILLLVSLVPIFNNSDFVKSSPVLSRFIGGAVQIKNQPRFTIWNMSFKGFLERPVFGWGPDNYNVVFNKHFDPSLWRQEVWFDRAHNVILDWLVATGVFGLASYLFLLGSAFCLLWQKVNNFSLSEKAIFTGLLSGYFFQNLFVFDNVTSYIIFFALLGYVHFRSDESPWLKSKISAGIIGERIHKVFVSYKDIFAVLIAVALVFGVYFVNVKPIMANRLMISSLFPHSIDSERLSNIKKIFALKTFGSMETREQLLFLLSDARNQQGLDQALLLKALELGYDEMQKQLQVTGNDARHQLFMASFLHSFGRFDDAQKYYENAKELSPRKQIILFSLSRLFRDRGELNKALDLAKESYELDRSYDKAVLEYAIATIYTGDNNLSKELLTSQYGSIYVPDPSLIKAYADTNQFSKVSKIWEEQITKNPNNVQAYISLAASYYADGRDSKAIETIRKLILIDPSKKEQSEQLIEQIRNGSLPRK